MYQYIFIYVLYIYTSILHNNVFQYTCSNLPLCSSQVYKCVHSERSQRAWLCVCVPDVWIWLQCCVEGYTFDCVHVLCVGLNKSFMQWYECVCVCLCIQVYTGEHFFTSSIYCKINIFYTYSYWNYIPDLTSIYPLSNNNVVRNIRNLYTIIMCYCLML